MKKILSFLLASAMVFLMSIAAQARLVGDVDKNGTVNSFDALEVLTYAVGINSTIDKERADVNSDGVINSSDALDILSISVGSYAGELEILDKTSYKKDYIDPVIKSGTFTLKMNVDADGQKMPMLMAFDKDKMYASFSMEGLEAAILYKDGKTYILLPNLLEGLKVYMEAGEEDVGMDGIFEAFDSISDDTAYYVGTSKVKVGSKYYLCEEYEDEYGYVYRYYFDGTDWKRYECISEDESIVYDISSFKNTVDKSLFSLSGYIKVDPNMPIF